MLVKQTFLIDPHRFVLFYKANVTVLFVSCIEKMNYFSKHVEKHEK